ncbi:Nramp family divalent metal transporter [Pseudomaricurvus alkylphenolicus]|uniref:Nramp family divalent metal transporter n=1 Tax=Pseudomaricurvus alkylphenolicus TaxID=1306991 RepID=UPI001F0FBACA|nr:Nramp family divalent metal transporter [Pseudomaricurvus alkylphenolicus]
MQSQQKTACTTAPLNGVSPLAQLSARLRNLGPGVMVAAAIIGPGTITACTLAGANFGYALLWALVFATLATIILQEMAARLGTITQKGLGEALAYSLRDSLLKWPLFALISVALFVGNCAYEAGNLTGAALGIQALTGEDPHWYRLSIGAIALGAGFVLWRGNYQQIEKALLTLVVIMGLSFITTFLVVKPDWSALFSGLLTPTIPAEGLFTVVALIGTTVVPYNLFLHASAVKNRWRGEQALGEARADTYLSLSFGGLIAILVVSTAAASLFGSGLAVRGGADMAVQLEPLFGSYAKYLLGIGFFAAGLSSAITAPLATAYAMSEVLGFGKSNQTGRFRTISMVVLVCGSLLAMTGIKPLTIILSAQFANGLLLPIITGFLLFAMNQKTLLGKYTNGLLANTLGGVVLLVSVGLGARSILSALNIL